MDHGLRLLAIANPATLVPNIVRIGERNITSLGRGEVEALHRELRDFLMRVVSAPAGVLIPVPGDDDGREAIVCMTAPGVKPAIYGTSFAAPLSWGGLVTGLWGDAAGDVMLVVPPG